MSKYKPEYTVEMVEVMSSQMIAELLNRNLQILQELEVWINTVWKERKEGDWPWTIYHEAVRDVEKILVGEKPQ